MSLRKSGFSLLELLIVVLIVGTVAGAAVPHLQRALLRARATEVLGDFRTVEVAVLNYQADEGDWPGEVDRGTIPPGLESYLPEGFSFTRERYVLDYDDWSDSEPFLVGISMITDDQELGFMVYDLLGANAWTNGEDTFARVIEWTD